MFKIGCHLSASRGYLAMGREAVSIGAGTFQFFTRNPRGGSVKPLDLEDIENYKRFASENGIGQILAHAPYTLNPCAEKEYIREFTYKAMCDDIARLEHIPGTLYNFHPGSHVGQGMDTGIKYIADMLNKIMFPDMKTTVLLETMAGKGSEVGGRFEELRAIIDSVELSDKIGVCLDTCHVFDAGYDISGNLDGVLEEFDAVLGIDRLKAIHLNDTKNPMASHKDRHEKIGEGYLGIEALSRVINHPKLRELPFLLETPNDLDGYAGEISLLKGRYINA